MEKQPLIIGIGGTLRPDSSSEKALRVSLRAAEVEGASVVMVAGRALELPMYTPGIAGRSTHAAKLIDLFRRCEGMIISAPAYHGSISGLVKNALDYTEDLNADERVYFDGCAIGLIACGAGWQGTGQTLAALRSIAHALRGWPTPIGAMLNTTLPAFDPHGECTEPSVKSQLEGIGRQVVRFARMMRASCNGPL
jgi:FMN reductase